MEFFLGNTFPSIVFTTFGAFWLSYGGTLQPYFNAVIACVLLIYNFSEIELDTKYCTVMILKIQP